MLRTSAVFGLLAALPLTVACGDVQPTDPGPKVTPVYTDPDPQQPLEVIAIDEEEAWNVDGLAVDPTTGELHVLMSGVGIVVYDAEGTETGRVPFAEGSPWDPEAEPAFYDIGYRDIDLLPDGAYVLAGPFDSHYFDPDEGAPASYFCLLPGFEEIVMVNQALAVDPVTDLILVAPTYFNYSVSDEPTEAYHVAYFMDGTQQSSHDVLASHIVAQGLARDAQSNEVFAVEEGELAVFSLDGQYKRSYTLDGIERASGLAIDVQADILWVTDAADHEVRSFDAAQFRD
jgi:hypothetical protein